MILRCRLAPHAEIPTVHVPEYCSTHEKRRLGRYSSATLLRSVAELRFEYTTRSLIP